MSGMLIAFIIWGILGCAFVGLGMYSLLSKKEVAFGFWANAEVFPVNNVTAYNRAVGILWIVFGLVFILMGLPLLKGQNSPYIVFLILGVMVEAIAAMTVYTTVIEKKYRKK